MLCANLREMDILEDDCVLLIEIVMEEKVEEKWKKDCGRKIVRSEHWLWLCVAFFVIRPLQVLREMSFVP